MARSSPGRRTCLALRRHREDLHGDPGPGHGCGDPRTVSETGHDMFCPGISILADGRVLVTGGDDSAKTSIYNPSTDTWTTGPSLTSPGGIRPASRCLTGAYSSSAVRGAAGWVARTARCGRQRPVGGCCPVRRSPDPDQRRGGIYRADNHAWLFSWSDGMVLQAGPSKAMNWFNTMGAGSTVAGWRRGRDNDAMNGNAVMYDAGKILTIGGSASYETPRYRKRPRHHARRHHRDSP